MCVGAKALVEVCMWWERLYVCGCGGRGGNKYKNVSNRGVKRSHVGYVVVEKCTLGVINLCSYSMLGLIVVTTSRF